MRCVFILCVCVLVMLLLPFSCFSTCVLLQFCVFLLFFSFLFLLFWSVYGWDFLCVISSSSTMCTCFDEKGRQGMGKTRKRKKQSQNQRTVQLKVGKSYTILRQQKKIEKKKRKKDDKKCDVKE